MGTNLLHHKTKAFFCENNLKKIAFVFIAVFIHLSLFGQNRKIIFQSLQQGLSNQLIQCILKDRQGFMWIGTSEGLHKFDGSNIMIYENNLNDSNSISHNSINALIEDKHGRLWIGTADGLNFYDRDKNNFKSLKIPGFPRICVNALCSDNYDNIWIGTIGNGIIVYDQKKSGFYIYSNNPVDNTSVSSNFISSIVTDNLQNVWIGTNNGLNLFSNDKRNFVHFSYPQNSSNLRNTYVNVLYYDHKGSLWIGTIGEGLYRLQSVNNGFRLQHFKKSNHPDSLSNNNILTLCEDVKGKIWIGTDNGGLNCLNSKTGVFCRYQPDDGNPGSIASNSIRSLYCDNNNNILWIGTYNQGINFIDEKFEKFQLFQKGASSENSIGNNEVTGFAEDPSGNIWIATDGGGISRFDPVTRMITPFAKGHLSNNYVQTVICDKNENLWVSTWNDGIDRFDRKGRKIKTYKIEGSVKVGENRVKFLYQDKQNNIWAGSNGSGLFLFRKDKDKFIPIVDNLGPRSQPLITFVTSILEDSENTIWVGTLNGLVKVKRVNNNEFSFSLFNINLKGTNINSTRIIAIFEDSRRNLWFGTLEKGLHKLNRTDNSVITYSKEEGLPSNSIKSILEDRSGNLWIATNNGISRFNPTLKSFKNYKKEDGLNSNNFYPNSCLKSESGELFFGGINGFNVFNPDSLKENNTVPPIYLTDFKIFNKSVAIGEKGSPLQRHISQTRKIVLTHKQSSFTVDFVALNYTRSSQNQYSYILEGLESEWNYNGNSRSASYTYIKPGTYLFKVIGSNNDGIWNNNPATLTITILPPFWKTIWAYILYFLVFSILLFIVVRLQVIKAKQSQLIELDKMKLDFFTNISHELRTPLTLILSPLENLVSSANIENELRNQLSLIYRNADRLFRLVNELMDFSKTEDSELKIVVQPGDIVKFTREIFELYSYEARRKNIKYEFVSKENNLEVWFDRDKIEKVILNLLSNAFKFTSSGGIIFVRLEKTIEKESKELREYVKISVTDNGVGIHPKFIDKIFDRFFQSPDEKSINKLGTGIGLTLSKNLMKLHHGKIEVTSERLKETCFSVFLPLGNSLYSEDEINAVPLDISTTSSISYQEANPISPKNAPIVLVAEDNYDLRKYLVSQLSAKFKIMEAENGEEAFKIAITENPDLIISDVVMPGMSGVEVCKKVKEELATSHIPVVLLTAKVTLEDKIEGIQTGADAYITKPFNIRFLEVTITNLIGTRLKLMKRFSQEVYITPKECGTNTLDQKFLERTIDFIERNISNEELIVNDLASHLLLSHSQTYRKIKALTGQSVTELIRTIRLKMAIRLMEKGEYNISEIGFKVGFTSPAYFTKCFRDQFGKPPSEYLSEISKKK